MQRSGWSQRYLESTRGRIIALLRSATRTVNELAEALSLTDNAVRAHLVALERDGLVRQSGLRRGLRKPHFAYHLTPEAEQLFPKAYGPLLNAILDVLAQELPPERVEALLREAGHQIAERYLPTVQRHAVEARVEKALEVLGEMGGLAQRETEEERLFIRGASCPLSAIAADHPQVCLLVETLLADIIGVPVYEHCQQGDQPRCCFEIVVK